MEFLRNHLKYKKHNSRSEDILINWLSGTLTPLLSHCDIDPPLISVWHFSCFSNFQKQCCNFQKHFFSWYGYNSSSNFFTSKQYQAKLACTHSNLFNYQIQGSWIWSWDRTFWDTGINERWPKHRKLRIPQKDGNYISDEYTCTSV